MPLISDALARLWPRQRTRTSAEAKASRTGPLLALETLGRPVWTPRDYQSFAREGFMANAIVYRAVRMISEAAASVPLLLYEGDTDTSDHPLLDLLADPSPGQTGTDFLEAWYGYLLVAGNAYVEAVALDGRLRELHALRPDRMKVVPGPEGWPEAYEYTAQGHTIRFEDEPVPRVRPVLHVRLFHPANDHYGMSPIEAAAVAIDTHNTAAQWNKALLDNSARPSGALVYGGSDGRMTAEQFERLKAELEASFQGAKQAGRPLLLEGGLDWKPLSLSPKDMDFYEARNSAAREIALALGVPPMLLGIPGDNTYSNYQEAQRALWRNTVLPLVNRTAKAFTSWLAPAYGGGIALRPDLDQVEALTSEREALWARIDRVSFLTLDEKRAAVGYAPIEGRLPDPATDLARSSVPRAYRASPEASKYRPDQARAPAGQSNGGEWVDEGGGGGGRALQSGRADVDQDVLSDARDPSRDGDQIAQAPLRHRPPRPRIGESWIATPAQEARLAVVEAEARIALERVRELDPEWRPRPSLTETAEGAIRRAEGERDEAVARRAEITRDALPSANPTWGVNRLRKELNFRGFSFRRPTDSAGELFENAGSGEQLRIMERPARQRRTDPPEKHTFGNYYRYRRSVSDPWGSAIPIPDQRTPEGE